MYSVAAANHVPDIFQNFFENFQKISHCQQTNQQKQRRTIDPYLDQTKSLIYPRIFVLAIVMGS